MTNETSVALVTGAARGIGRGIAASLLRAGWSVVLSDLDEEAGQAASTELGSLGPARFRAMDVADEDSVAGCLAWLESEFGRLDGLVNNAGIADPHSGPPQHLHLTDWNRWLATNLTGAFLVCKHAHRLLAGSSGAIVNIASTRALQSEPHTEAYAASKGGLVALTHALAVSWGPDVRVNAISPGWIDSRDREQREHKPLRDRDHRQHAAGRVGLPADIGALAAFLLGPDAAFITGQNYIVDGGMTRQMIYAD
jgi:NAD(P)-dependent dehydrogenase (short-subunit alcohol dehydrogenase family)